jgi:hypothetical protein
MEGEKKGKERNCQTIHSFYTASPLGGLACHNFSYCGLTKGKEYSKVF